MLTARTNVFIYIMELNEMYVKTCMCSGSRSSYFCHTLYLNCSVHIHDKGIDDCRNGSGGVMFLFVCL